MLRGYHYNALDARKNDTQRHHQAYPSGMITIKAYHLQGFFSTDYYQASTYYTVYIDRARSL